MFNKNSRRTGVLIPSGLLYISHCHPLGLEYNVPQLVDVRISTGRMYHLDDSRQTYHLFGRVSAYSLLRGRTTSYSVHLWTGPERQ